MTTYNTGNPLGSTDPRDLYDNSQALDEAVNGVQRTFLDRFGIPRKTIKGATDDVALSQGLQYDTLVDLNNSPGVVVGQMAHVTQDSNAANNGVYAWSGTQWVKKTDPWEAYLTMARRNGFFIIGELNYQYYDNMNDQWIVSFDRLTVVRGSGKGQILIAPQTRIAIPKDRVLYVDITNSIAGDTVTALVTPSDYLGSSYGNGSFVEDLKLPLFTYRNDGIAGLLANKVRNEVVFAKDSPWFTALGDSTVNYDLPTRTLSWTNQIVFIANFENTRRTVVVNPGSIVIPVSNYCVVWFDARLPADDRTTTPFEAADIFKVGRPLDSQTDPNAFLGRSYQIPVFYHGNGNMYGPANGFFERQITGVNYPYDTSRIAALEQVVANLPTPETGGGGAIGAMEPIYLQDGKLMKSGSDGEIVYVDPAPNAFSGVAQRVGGATVTTLNRPTIGTTTPTAVGGELGFVGQPMVIPSASNVLLVIPSFGQSNSVGSQGYDPATPLTVSKYGDTLLMPAGPGFMDIRMNLPSGAEAVGSETPLDPGTITGFKPAISMQSQQLPSQGATPLEVMGMVFADAVHNSLGFDPKICMYAAGWGGRFQSDLAKGSIPYQNLLTALTKIKSLAAARGWKVFVPFIAVIHGESDSTRPAYLDGIKTWQTDFNADIKAITEQQGDVPFICTQASTFQGGASINGVLAPYNASEPATTHHLAAPYYPYDLADDLLHLGKSAPFLGEKIAHTAARVYGLFGKDTYGTLRPINVLFDGANTIDITFHVPVKPLVRDTTDATVNSPAPADWGFRIRDGSGAGVAINSIEITSADSVRIVTAASPSAGTFRSVDYAMVGFGSPKVRGAGARGQLRDSEDLKSIVDGRSLPNWMPHFRELF